MPVYLLAPPSLLFDFPQAYTPARLVLEGKAAQVYNLDALKAEQQRDFPALKQIDRPVTLHWPPAAILFWLPIGLFPAQVAAPIWWGLSVLSLALSLFVLAAVFQLSQTALVRLGAATAAFAPQWETIKHGQMTAFSLLVFSVFTYLIGRGRSLVAALVFSACLVRPQMFLPFLGFVIGARRYKLVAYMVLFLFLLLLASYLLLGAETYRAYAQVLVDALAMRQRLSPQTSPTLRGQLMRILPSEDGMVLLVSCAADVVAVTGAFLWGRANSQSNRWLEIGILASIPLGMLTALHFHAYDALLLLPCLLIVLKYRLYRMPLPFRLVAGAAALCFFMPLYNKLHYDYVLTGGILNPLFFALSILTVAGFCLGRSLALGK